MLHFVFLFFFSFYWKQHYVENGTVQHHSGKYKYKVCLSVRWHLGADYKQNSSRQNGFMC